MRAYILVQTRRVYAHVRAHASRLLRLVCRASTLDPHSCSSVQAAACGGRAIPATCLAPGARVRGPCVVPGLLGRWGCGAVESCGGSHYRRAGSEAE
jgi:hypothetical protein